MRLKQAEEQLKRFSFTEDAFKSDDARTKLYTGLTSHMMLFAVFELVKNHLTGGGIVSPFGQLILTLMKLHLDLPLSYLSHIFNVSISTASRYFNDTIHVLYIRLVPIAIVWPERNIVKNCLPDCFQRTFPNCISIIDCFEIFIETPKNLLAKATTYSNYKSHNTVKYLISITPQGVINFISVGWGGRASDRHITQCSTNYLTKLNPGDVVLADRGFKVDEIIALHGATLYYPAFTKGRSQLSEQELTATRNLAAVRIHVERVIGHLRKKYTMLSGTIPITLLQPDDSSYSTIDKIVHVACALTNICESVVPM